MRRREINPAQLDLLEWAASQPSAKILSAIPAIARRMWRERHETPTIRDGKLLPLQARSDERRRA
jgi:hypothetical protein